MKAKRMLSMNFIYTSTGRQVLHFRPGTGPIPNVVK